MTARNKYTNYNEIFLNERKYLCSYVSRRILNCGKTWCPSVARATLWVPPGNQLKPTGWTPYPELQPSPPTSDALALVCGIPITIPEIKYIYYRFKFTITNTIKSTVSHEVHRILV